MTTQPILIAGAGPGGLCAALALQQRGVPYLLLERASRERLFADVGGGYDISKSTLEMLDSMGIGDAVRDCGRRFSSAWSMTSEGDVFDRMAFPMGMDTASIMRSALQRIFLAKIETSRLRCNSEVVSLQASPDQVEVLLKNGERIEGSALIAADGVHSAVRNHLFKDGPPRFCGLTCVWGRIDPKQLPKDVSQLIPPNDCGLSIMGKGAICLAGNPHDQWLWSVFWRTESFERSDSKKAAKARVLNRFADWTPLVIEVVERTSTEHIAEVGIWDRDPATQWTNGRCALIGDAAHPMTPFIGQGANSAMIDGFVLAHYLSQHRDDPDAALAHYVARRKKTNEKTVKTARFVAEWMTSESPLSAFAFRAMMRVLPSSLIIRSVIATDKANDVQDLIAQTAIAGAA